MSWDKNAGWQDAGSGQDPWGKYQDGNDEAGWTEQGKGGWTASGEERRYCPGDKQVYTYAEYMAWALESFGGEGPASEYWQWKMEPVEPAAAPEPEPAYQEYPKYDKYAETAPAAEEEKRYCHGDKSYYTYTEFMEWAPEMCGGQSQADEYWATMPLAESAPARDAAPYEAYAEPEPAEEKRLCPSDKQEYTLNEYLSWAMEYFTSNDEAMDYWDRKMKPVGGSNDKGSWKDGGYNSSSRAGDPGRWLQSDPWADSGGAGGGDSGGWGNWGEDPGAWATNLSEVNWHGVSLVPVGKDFYHEHPDVQRRTLEQVADIRRSKDIEVLDSAGRAIPNPVLSFQEASFPDWLQEKVVRKGFKEPSPIQVQTWPVALQGRDLIGIAETGSGKTLAYLLPMMVHIMAQQELKAGEGPVGVVLCPTRELALQIHQVCQEFIGSSGMQCCCVYGGGSVRDQGYALQAKNDIVIGTPGRFIQLLNEQWTNLNRVTYVVLDEADEMLQKGFDRQVKLILSQIRPDRQVQMFSATWGADVQDLAREHCKDEPVTVRIGGDRLACCKTISQNVLVLEEQDKFTKLKEAILRSGCLKGSGDKLLIFCRTKQNVNNVEWMLSESRIEAGAMHSDKRQDERIAVLERFKNGDLNVMAATNCLGRGHDIPRVRYVINYDAPDDIQSYIHRVGRTGRAGEAGFAMTLLTAKDAKLAQPLMEVLNQTNQKVTQQLTDLAHSVQYEQHSWGGWNETVQDWAQPEAEPHPAPRTLGTWIQSEEAGNYQSYSANDHYGDTSPYPAERVQ